MAVDMFIKIGDIKGESADKAHKETIDVLSWSWGMTQSGTMHHGKGGGSGKVSVQDLSFSKRTDSASHALVKAVCDGSHFKEAMLYIRKAGKTPLDYLKIKMTDVLITSYQTGGTNQETDVMHETWTLNFAKFAYDYTEQNADGSKGATKSSTWDIAGNAA